MSKGLGRIERRIIHYFTDISTTATIEELCSIAYSRSGYFVTPDWRLTRSQEVSVRRALKRLQAEGYPLDIIRLEGRGRPWIVSWYPRLWKQQVRARSKCALRAKGSA
jgi:hypothetical protein